jgi:hypothetical protein
MLAANYLAAEPECSTPLLKQLAFGHNAWAISIHLHFSHPIFLTSISSSECLFSKEVSHQNFVGIPYFHYPNCMFIPSYPMLTSSGDLYKSHSSSLCNITNFPLADSSLRTNVFMSIVFKHVTFIFSPCSKRRFVTSIHNNRRKARLCTNILNIVSKLSWTPLSSASFYATHITQFWQTLPIKERHQYVTLMTYLMMSIAQTISIEWYNILSNTI